MNEFSYIFLFFLVTSLLLKLWLNRRQMTHIIHHRDAVPEDFKGKIDLAAHQKAADYTVAKTKMATLSTLIGSAVLIMLTLGGFINILLSFMQSTIDSDIWSGIALIMSVFILSHFIELPVDIYQTFKIEQQFGFNRTTVGQFIKDQFLQIALMLIIGTPLLYALLYVMGQMGEYWWLYAWLLTVSFTFFMTWLVPTVIAPLFNKFTPLDNDELKTRIQQLFERCGFNSKGIYVMDGSKRSGHGNAYFTGIGNNKRIVFYDTLIESLNTDEIEAVLAHELGHFKCKHVTKHMLVSTVTTLLGFALLGWLKEQNWFFDGLGMMQINNAISLLLFILVLPIFTTFLQPISSRFQRKFEFEADAFASTMAKPEHLIQALVKLYRENASTLTPDPLYSSFHHSHPPASVRIDHLRSLAGPTP
ncbi:MAG: peptidase M48 [Cycloclasticus sp. symbiont of Bathymodiolus heckerae]|nr:MAG: peptidase M48 [Cycloclasticus sp. symbiont of Bathymodiolus heckerae]